MDGMDGYQPNEGGAGDLEPPCGGTLVQPPAVMRLRERNAELERDNAMLRAIAEQDPE
jgi:hypothetical protein